MCGVYGHSQDSPEGAVKLDIFPRGRGESKNVDLLVVNEGRGGYFHFKAAHFSEPFGRKGGPCLLTPLVTTQTLTLHMILFPLL